MFYSHFPRQHIDERMTSPLYYGLHVVCVNEEAALQLEADEAEWPLSRYIFRRLAILTRGRRPVRPLS